MEQPFATRFFSLYRLGPVRELVGRWVFRGETVEKLYDPHGALGPYGDELPADRFLDRLRAVPDTSLVEAPFVTRALLEAYRRTSYVATLPGGEVRIRIGEPQPMLEGSAWAFVTAENPGSARELPREVNQRRTRELAALLAGQWTAFPARAIPDGQDWLVEHGFLIRDIPVQAAVDLGRSRGQNAIVSVEPDEPARLVLCFPE